MFKLDDWEAKAPLTHSQLSSVNAIRLNCSQPKISTYPHTHSRPFSPRKPAHPSLLHSVLSPSSLRSSPPTRPGTPNHDGPSLSISTPQQFYDWFSKLTASLEHEQDALYRDHLAEIAVYREACDMLVEQCEDAETVCGHMEESFKFVEERSKSLQLACEELLEEQNRLIATSDELIFRLTYFSSLEPATRMLNASGSQLATRSDFLPLVDRMEDCLLYLKAHRDYKDAELYILRYQQCLARSMTLIKIYAVAQFKALGVETSKRMGETNLSETALHTLLYLKPQSLAPHLRLLILELEYRSIERTYDVTFSATRPTIADDMSPLLAECQDAWLGVRQGLLGAAVRAEVAKLDPGRGDLVDLTRAGCGYLKRLCSEEYALYRQFFETGDEKLMQSLETFCDYLYDYLRPRILHEPSLTVLCQVCTVLQALMVLDTTDDDDDLSDSDSDDEFSPPSPHEDRVLSPLPIRPNLLASPSVSVRSFHSPKSRFFANPEEKAKARKVRKKQLSSILTPVLQDAQTRLVFRAQAVIQLGVGRFVPGEADLDYPAKILKAHSSKVVEPELFTMRAVENLNDPSEQDDQEDRNEEDDGALFRLPSMSVQETWYPTLRKTLWVLEELHYFVDPAIFEDIAQEAISLCRQSLQAAADQISTKQSKADGGLFVVRHLLILKEMLGSVEMVGNEMGGDMLGVTEAFSALLSSAMSFLPSALTFGYGPSSQAPGSSRSTGQITDIKLDLDRNLKTICEELIEDACIRSTEPIQPFLNQATAFLAASKSTSTGDLGSQPWARPERVLSLHETLQETLRKEVAEWVGKLRVYLEDGKAVDVLIPPMQSSIIDSYRQFHEIVRSEYDFSVSSVVWSPVRMWEFVKGICEEPVGAVEG